MRKRFLSFMIIWLSICATAGAQVTISLQVPPTGVMQKGQLWNMALIYTGTGSINVTVSLMLMSARDNQPVMTAISRPITLTKGTNPVNVKDASPIQYDYLSPIFNVDRDPGGFLPVGNYKACYSVMNLGGHNTEPFAEDCIPVEVQPLSPPQLNTPADTATLETAYPQFSWLPAMPMQLFSHLTYDMLVVEVLPGQGPYEAIQQNIPVYNISHYNDAVHLYPMSNAPLDTGRRYAWRVIAKNEDEFVAQSEVWTFKLAAHTALVAVPPNGNYILLRDDREPAVGMEVLTSPILGVKHYSFDKEHEAEFRFVSGEGKVVKTVRRKIAYGDNFIGFALDGPFEKDKPYTIETVDVHHARYAASFTIHQKN